MYDATRIKKQDLGFRGSWGGGGTPNVTPQPGSGRHVTCTVHQRSKLHSINCKTLYYFK
ncbi:hypothetical protein HanRHA438_Chr11g0498281 [Helianthus annuus]|nr:hypothetical protein HanRHA438_Chr11g0498281 [Helianthus annuus]